MEEYEKILDSLIVGNRPDFSRRVLFLDFDGPINLGPHYIPSEDEQRTIQYACVDVDSSDKKNNELGLGVLKTEYPISYYKEVIELFRSLNCVWLTSWKRVTQEKLNHIFGFDFGYVDWKYRGISDPGFYGKQLAVSKIITSAQCDWLIVDDEFPMILKDVIEKETKITGNVINPDWEHGLSIEQMEEIQRLMSYGY